MKVKLLIKIKSIKVYSIQQNKKKTYHGES